MALFGKSDRRNRGWGGSYYGRRNRNWEPHWETSWKPRKRSFRAMLVDFLIRLVAFTVLCVLGLAWVKYHFLGGQFRSF